MKVKTFETEIGGKKLIAEFNDLAEQAHGSVMLRYGNTIVLATAVMSKNKKEGLDYFPLTVDFEEKFYAAGAILGSRFIRREGRPSEEAILSGRVVDRTIRPLFDSHIRNEVQVIITVLSIDEDDPDVLAINAASLALATSDIPWKGPASAVRIGKVTGGSGFVINPTYKERNGGEALDLLACGKDGTINMIEVAAKEAGEKELAEALTKASEEIEKLQAFQKKIIAEIGKAKKGVPTQETPQALISLFDEGVRAKLPAALFSGAGNKEISSLKEEWKLLAKEKLPDIVSSPVDDLYEEAINDLIHEEAVKNERRADGRALGELRSLYAKAGEVSPVLHGSGIFYRGGTHVFSALTLGGPGDSQLIDSMEEQEAKKRFMHHYNFPPFAPGETGRVGGFNRRMIGHGALAEKSLEAVIPSKEAFPYTIRLVSESMASNGSTSMASVCASSLALHDGGVPIKGHVAGIAMGLMMTKGGYKILTDIQGPEDHHGDMDFKVAGTRAGVTGIQLDVKVDGIPLPILFEALEDAKKARLTIIEKLEEAIPLPRPTISPRAPEIVITAVKKDQIGLVIGTGGKTINGIKETAGVDDISIEEDGTIFITGKNGSAGVAKKMIEDLTHEFKPGEVVEGEVTRITDFGAFVKIGTTAEGLVHISEIAPFRIARAGDALSLGEKIKVIVKEIDERERIALSIKLLDPDFAARKGLKPSAGNGAPHRRGA